MFSFDLNDEILSLRAKGLLGSQTGNHPYGPRFFVTEQNRLVLEHYPKLPCCYKQDIDLLVRNLSKKGVLELERLSVAMYVRMSGECSCIECKDVYRLVIELVELQPHLPGLEAMQATKDVDTLVEAYILKEV